MLHFPRLINDCAESSARAFPTAETELAAFMTAVREMYGPEEASESAEDWLQELEAVNWALDARNFNWRRLTIAAAARLADRVNARLEGNVTSHSNMHSLAGR